jgi:PTH1 family peptidyl-tRNA hydrolase
MHLLVALGNPGKKYEKTRHNVAWIVVDQLFGADDWETSSQGQALFKREENFDVIKPQTFMNKSGESVRFFVKKKNLEPHQIIVMHDDIDLPIGSMKISKSRGSGGHNGVQSVANHLGSKDFIRIRIGVSGKRLFSNKLAKPNVLGRFSGGHMRKVEALTTDIQNAISTIISDGAEAAMNRFN